MRCPHTTPPSSSGRARASTSAVRGYGPLTLEFASSSSLPCPSFLIVLGLREKRKARRGTRCALASGWCAPFSCACKAHRGEHSCGGRPDRRTRRARQDCVRPRIRNGAPRGLRLTGSNASREKSAPAGADSFWSRALFRAWPRSVKGGRRHGEAGELSCAAFSAPPFGHERVEASELRWAR